MRFVRLLMLFTLLALSAMPMLAQEAQTPDEICAANTPAQSPDVREYEMPETVLEAGVNYQAIFCTSAGAVYIDLLEDYAPITVNNMLFLAQQGYYNNTTFHRVIADFMAQGGDPTASGMGGPGYQFIDEPVAYLTFDEPGLLAMANAGPGTNGSQFFITTAPTPHLNYQHTVFGVVLAGQDNVNNIELRDPATSEGPGTSLDTIVIITDPAQVNAEVTPNDSPSASQEEVQAAFEAIAQYLPPELTESTTSVLTGDEIVAAAPEEAQALLEGLFSTHNHQYRATNIVNSTSCAAEESPFFSYISYTLDAYGTPADATNALTDAAFAEATFAEGFTHVDTSESLPWGLYSAEDTFCEGEGVRVRSSWQRGQFVATVESVLPEILAENASEILRTTLGTQLYEYVLMDILRNELP